MSGKYEDTADEISEETMLQEGEKAKDTADESSEENVSQDGEKAKYSKGKIGFNMSERNIIQTALCPSEKPPVKLTKAMIQNAQQRFTKFGELFDSMVEYKGERKAINSI